MKCFYAIMSEFKYACPVCGQHIKCDSSQAGTQMECPTCFQKIIVPQAPTEEQKFILTGTKVSGERPLPKAPDASTSFSSPTKTLPGVAVVIIIFLFIAAAVGFVYRGTIFKKPGPPQATQPAPTPSAPVAVTPAPSPPPRPSRPPLVAPPANDTNWTLNLKGMAIPDAPAAGRVEGQDFICQRGSFTSGMLALRNGDLSVTINFSGATPESLAGKSISVATNAAAAARIIFRWKVGDQIMRESFTNDYALLLDFDPLANNRVSGKIYLCTADTNKSYVAGTFKAEIRKPRPRNQ
jgi:DNA-directed RNA polymerase subunit RPC12/RpoP